MISLFPLIYSADCVNNSKQDEKAETIPANYILLYEDNEGDRMLVGDVPWEYAFQILLSFHKIHKRD